jgi:transcriptional regulator with XRE-family HTH domain
MNNKASKETAKRIKAIRLQKGLTQLALAEKAGINVNYYSKVERAELKPSVDILEKIVKALGVKSSDIFPF